MLCGLKNDVENSHGKILGWKQHYLHVLQTFKLHTLESGINVATWINVATENFGKKNKRSPIYALYKINLLLK